MEYIATFGSAYKALKAEKTLKEKDIPFQLIPTPKKIAAHCDLSITFQGDDSKTVEDALNEKGIKVIALYRREGDSYVKV